MLEMLEVGKGVGVDSPVVAPRMEQADKPSNKPRRIGRSLIEKKGYIEIVCEWSAKSHRFIAPLL